MYIRRTNTRSRKSGDSYFTYRLVESVRVDKAVKQRTLLNLGRHFDLPETEWPSLALRIEDLLHGQKLLPKSGYSEQLETLAQRYAAQLITRSEGDAISGENSESDTADRFHEVDLSTLEQIRPRTVGVEHAALSMIRELELTKKLAEFGFTKPQIAAALGNIIGRIAAPASEHATYSWLQNKTALGELIGYDYEGMDLQLLYRSADNLLKNRESLESHLFGSAKNIFGLTETITLYDLTNTYFEGVCAANSKAKRGKSKEKRSDCPLVTLGLVLDMSGFPKRSKMFSGNVSEGSTLKEMLEGLGALPGATVVMDAGIATEANLSWLKQNKHPYVVVSRRQDREFDPEKSVEVKTTGGAPIQIQRVEDEANKEALLYCYSAARAEKDKAIDTTKSEKYEAALQKLAAGLTKKGGTKNPEKIFERIGRAKGRYPRAAQHYSIDVIQDNTKENVISISWTRNPKAGSSACLPGVYCLRTTHMDFNEDKLWNIYTMLTNLESVFRSLKTDLGLRPVYHQIERRVEGHLFISVLAYYVVHTLRMKLKAKGIVDCWETIRSALSSQVRITATLQRRDGRTVHIRKASRPEPHQQKICAALELSANPGGTQQAVI
jgi:transposase